MRTRFASLSGRSLAIGAIVAVVLYAAAGWMLVVGPERSEAARLADDVAAAELRLAEAQASVAPRAAGVSVSDVLRLERAMPEGGDQVGLVLELATLARASGVTLRSVAPQVPEIVEGGVTAVPVTVAVRGSFFAITRFLTRTRTLVALHRGEVRATGRLFAVESVELAEAVETGFPTLDAAITLNAFVYSGPLVPAEGEDAVQETDGSEPTGTAAAGATP